MGLLQEKFAKYDLPQQFMAKGVYPYFREIDSHQDTEVLMDGKKVLMFGSNAYMGLTYDKRIIDAAKAATDKYGTGCAGSRLLNGTLDIHVQLEKELAEFVGKDEALCFSTGFTVNEGVIPQLVGRGDYIICDDRDHASIVDGRRLSFATQLKYKHNDMEDLEKELQKCESDAVKLIVVDGVFSMEGDLANLPEIVRLKKKYNASIYVDEAHGLGVFGRQGRGVCDHFGVTDDVDLIMGTFSKSLLLQQPQPAKRSTLFRTSPNASSACGTSRTTHWKLSVMPDSRLVTPSHPSSPSTFAIRRRPSQSPSWLSTKASSSIPSSRPPALRRIHWYV